MRWSDLPRDPSPATLRQFGALCLAVFGGLATYEYLGRGRAGAAAALGALGAGLGGVALIRPRWARPAFVGWMIAIFPISLVSSAALLALIYFVVVTPLGLALRLSGRDPLRLRRPGAGAETCWAPMPAVEDPRRYLRES